eukprot:761009-Hanusia_phi.AAC.3
MASRAQGWEAPAVFVRAGTGEEGRREGVEGWEKGREEWYGGREQKREGEADEGEGGGRKSSRLTPSSPPKCSIMPCRPRQTPKIGILRSMSALMADGAEGGREEEESTLGGWREGGRGGREGESKLGGEREGMRGGKGRASMEEESGRKGPGSPWGCRAPGRGRRDRTFGSGQGDRSPCRRGQPCRGGSG